MALKAVLFDLDGTLLDTADELIAVMNALRAERGWPPLSRKHAISSVSEGAKGMLQLALGMNDTDQDFAAARQRFLSHYRRNIGHATRLYPGLDHLLSWCARQGLRWGIVTNKTRDLTEELLARLALQPAPGSVVCPQDVSHSKPHPEPVLLACRQLNCEPESAVYIGDHRRDIEAGRSAGTWTIAASYGYLAANESAADWNADYQVHSSESLLDVVQALHQTTPDRTRPA